VAISDTLEELVGKALDDEGVQSFFFAEVIHKLFEVVV